MKKLKRFLQVFLCTVLIGSVFYSEAFAEDQYITVKNGDTLYSLAKKYHISVADLKEYNQLTSNKIIAGQKLVIPDFDESKPFYVVVGGSFSKKSNADKRVTFLKKKGIEAIVVKKVIDDQNYFRVQAGVFSSKSKAENLSKKLKDKGIKDAYFYTEKDLQINGITVDSTYHQLVQKFGQPTKTEDDQNTRALYYQGVGAGVRVTLNAAKDYIEQLQVYPDFFNSTSIPSDKSKILESYGNPNEIKIVTCYESAKCEQIVYQFNKKQLVVGIDRDGKTVQYLDLRKVK